MLTCVGCGKGFEYELDGTTCEACLSPMHWNGCSVILPVVRGGLDKFHVLCNPCGEMDG